MITGRTSRLKRFLSMPKYRGASRKRMNRGAMAVAEGSASSPIKRALRETELCGRDVSSVTLGFNAGAKTSGRSGMIII